MSMNNAHPWSTMKPWHAIIGMVGILILVCAPVVADMLPPAGWYDEGRVDYRPEPGFGTLSINSDPSGANVYLDEQYRGTTPLAYITSVYIFDGNTIIYRSGPRSAVAVYFWLKTLGNLPVM
jgi:hypothetical protein